VAALNTAFNTSMQRLATRLSELGVEVQPQYATPAAFDAMVRADLPRVAEVLRRAGVQPE
jgi:tripartite-type tricarboxylate transporter receptor subunit TctC